MDIELEAISAAYMHHASDAIIWIDVEGTIRYANPATEALLGFQVSEMEGQSLGQFVPPALESVHQDYVLNYLRTGEKKILGMSRETEARRKDGSLVLIHLAVSEVIVGAEHIFVGVMRDISAHHDKIATLAQMAGGIAHEIRTPLNAIKTSAYFLLNAPHASSEKTREHLLRIDRQVDDIERVIHALSDLVLFPEPKVQSHRIQEVLREAAHSVALPENVQLCFEPENEDMQALVDRQQMLIAFRNLIRNARDAMPEGGAITLNIRSQSQEVIVSVKDTGVGIPPEILPRIMQPLFSTKPRGMGLGLYTTRAIIHRHGGTIQVRSTPGQGSEFLVRLKRRD